MLELTDLTKKYGDFTAVNHISLRVEKGEIFGLLGPNGAGKSTTVSMISTVLPPTGGTICIDGTSLQEQPAAIKKVMGVVPQEIALYQALSAKDNLAFFGGLYGLSGKELCKRVDEVLDIIELQEQRHQRVSEFSGGMKRRVNIGAALMNEPKLFILDEPTVGIDPQSRHHILETVKTLNQEKGMTVIYTSHYMEEVEYLCEKAAIMDHGSIIACGTKDELKQSAKASDTLIVNAEGLNDDAVKKIRRISGVAEAAVSQQTITMLVSAADRNILDIADDIRKTGITIKGIHFEEANLESIFLRLTGKTLRDS
ncbi:ABC transporter ATP-binding protein [Bacillus sp. NEAU-CP5]|uniref:ABC transporter ATP-binding protein n=1 Tax=Bacillus TaxID=1386 RepID=UPI000B8C00AA|nr:MULTISPECIES: ABC transporter ATP-binding protein [Bacillus]ASP24910.1 export ABC transporter ATP-binding protein [Bacillus velezensis]ATL38200.1 ABC transporter ATP-binding protein [Bacillus velezensis]ATO09659.1 ABC transporter ATP-binding protein [Bacillus velezensis]MBE7958536.1 ABC transporter ATP-binding protein [Bacillus amyloliquefaciens]MBG9464366.1 antibiotic ABC transporter ATP-binding protein [Bacillus amyloliquefaciens]